MIRGKPIGMATLAVSLTALVGLDFLGFLGFLSGAEHHGGFWNSLPLGDLVLGTLAAGMLVWFSRRILKRFLTRPESYYDGDRGS